MNYFHSKCHIVNSYLLQEEASLVRGGDSLICEYNNKSLVIVLIKCPFSRLKVVGCTLGPMTYLAIDSCPW